MVEYELPKLAAWVRFPSPAPVSSEGGMGHIFPIVLLVIEMCFLRRRNGTYLFLIVLLVIEMCPIIGERAQESNTKGF